MSTNRSILIVVNPTAGRNRGRRTAENVASNLRARGLDVTVTPTARTGDAERVAKEVSLNEKRRPGCIVACGGDGTMQEVANALASLRPSLGDACPVMGLAPAGRCNDFARALGVSSGPAAIAEVLACGEPGAIDLGLINDRYFCTVATVGVDAEVSSYVDSLRMPLSGTAAYLYGAICVLSTYRPRELRITGDFGVIEGPVFLASSANTSTYGGAIRIAPAAVPTDGMLDLCVIRSVSRMRALRLLATVLAGRHGALPEVRFIPTRRFRIDSDEPLDMWADGERLGRTPASVEVAPGAVRVMLPGGCKSLSQ